MEQSLQTSDLWIWLYLFVNYINNQINNLCVASIFGVISDWMHACSVAQSCPILCDPMTVASQAPLSIEFSRQEEWVAISFFRWSFQPWNRTHISYISCISKRILCHRTTWEAQSLITSLIILLPRRGILKEGKRVIGRTFWISESVLPNCSGLAGNLIHPLYFLLNSFENDFQFLTHLTHLKRPWCWERLRAGGEGDDRGWDGWMASLTRWIWVWVDSGSWWWRAVVYGVTRSQTWLSNWPELNWTLLSWKLLQYHKEGY